jgi:MerR family transcriptional regulator, light-induced transcriptional regulator
MKEVFNFTTAMNQFTIKDIENLSGIKAHTWRIWEQRFGIAVPQRKDSNHRFYDNENLKQILRISYLYHAGFKISRIATLNTAQIRAKALERVTAESEYDYYIKELLEASIDLDEERFENTFSEALKRLGVEETILKVSYPFQDRIGVLWLTDHVIPAQEHFTSNIIRQKLSVAIDNLPLIKNTTKKEILLFTPEKEHHELPLQFIYYLLRKNSNKVIYYGSNVPLETIDTYRQNQRFEYMLFHLVTNLTHKNADDYVKEVSRRFADKQIVMSGVLVQQVIDEPPNVRLLRSMDEIVRFTQE